MENRASKGSIHRGPQHLSPITISPDFTSGNKQPHVGRGDMEREGKKLEVNEPELKINFFSVENQRLDQAHIYKAISMDLLLVYPRLRAWVLLQWCSAQTQGRQ